MLITIGFFNKKAAVGIFGHTDKYIYCIYERSFVMQLNTELDSLIEKYKSELIKLSAQYGGESAADSETDDSREASLHSQEVYTQEQEVLKDEYGHSDGNLYSREDEAQMPEEISDDFVSASEEKEASPNCTARKLCNLQGSCPVGRRCFACG